MVSLGGDFRLGTFLAYKAAERSRYAGTRFSDSPSQREDGQGVDIQERLLRKAFI